MKEKNERITIEWNNRSTPTSQTKIPVSLLSFEPVSKTTEFLTSVTYTAQLPKHL